MGNAKAKEASFSIASIIAIVAAIASFAVGAFWGFVLAGVAIISAIIGMVAALSPDVRGGIMSILALLAGGIALIVAGIQAIMWLFGG